jgi:hypothetical protein
MNAQPPPNASKVGNLGAQLTAANTSLTNAAANQNVVQGAMATGNAPAAVNVNNAVTKYQEAARRYRNIAASAGNLPGVANAANKAAKAAEAASVSRALRHAANIAAALGKASTNNIRANVPNTGSAARQA